MRTEAEIRELYQKCKNDYEEEKQSWKPSKTLLLLYLGRAQAYEKILEIPSCPPKPN